MSNLADLLAQKASIEKRIADAQREERASAIAQVKALMAQYGLSAADLSARSAQGARSGVKPGAKVPAKYRNAATGDSWSGRGLQPRWLKAALASGKKISDFAI